VEAVTECVRYDLVRQDAFVPCARKAKHTFSSAESLEQRGYLQRKPPEHAGALATCNGVIREHA
jgi:hypothetical protein